MYVFKTQDEQTEHFLFGEETYLTTDPGILFNPSKEEEGERQGEEEGEENGEVFGLERGEDKSPLLTTTRADNSDNGTILFTHLGKPSVLVRNGLFPTWMALSSFISNISYGKHVNKLDATESS